MKIMFYPYVLEFTKCAVQGVTISFSFFCPSGKAGGAQILRYQGIAVNNYGFTLGALALIPSTFCNDGGYSPSTLLHWHWHHLQIWKQHTRSLPSQSGSITNSKQGGSITDKVGRWRASLTIHFSNSIVSMCVRQWCRELDLEKRK